ncbi:MAG: histidine kinase N-terminal 7TM domain-containing protein [Haloarculaceae archaeon]
MVRFNWVVLPLVFPVVVAVPSLLVLRRHWDHPRLSPVAPTLLIASATLWSLSEAARLTVTARGLKLWLYWGYYLNGTVVVLTLFVFAADYTERTAWLRPRRFALVAAPLVATTLLELTNPAGLAIRAANLAQRGGLTSLRVDWGPVFYLHHAIAYAILGYAAYTFLTFERTNRHYRGQIFSILGAMVVPWALNVAYLTGVTWVNYTAVGFAVAIPVGVLMIFRYRVLDIVPVARSAVVDEMATGYLVLDSADVVVDVNDPARSLLDADGDLLGVRRRDLYERFPQIERAFEAAEPFPTITTGTGADARHYLIETSPLEGADGLAGSVVLFQDVTEMVRARRRLRAQRDQLERQNDRLEEFAGFLSHDLRNPLSVAAGRLELARADGDDENLARVAEALDRIDELVETALALAKQGRTVIDPDAVDLATASRRAWADVETADATLEVTVDRDVPADEAQLVQLLENLFRNAIEHGSTSPRSQAHEDAGDVLTVTVGALPDADGFYVADDGPGIPADERESVFEKGYTTNADGTGFGLAIVAAIADAHGWDVAVTESSAGGARFEFTDVSRPEFDGDDDPLEAN